MPGPRQPWLALVGVSLAVLAVGVAATGGGLSVGPVPPPRLPEEEESPGAEATTEPAPPPAPSDLPTAWELPGWLGTVFNVLGFALVAAILVGVLAVAGHYLVTGPLQRLPIIDRAASQPRGSPDPDEVRDAVRAGLAEIDAGGDPRRAVIACWLRLERVAAAAGTPRLAADTPEDLVTRLLAGHRVDDTALRALADAYRRARYAPAEVAAELRATAREALEQVAAQLGARGATRGLS